MPFVVQTDGKNKFVNIGIVSGPHGTHVTGIASGKGLFGGAVNGVAPGAQWSRREPACSWRLYGDALFEGMIYVAKQANVDVVNMSIGGLPGLNDGNNARGVSVRPPDRTGERADVLLHRQQRPRREHGGRPRTVPPA